MTDIFVFGSNLAGRHGRGSALEAVKRHGAVYGVGFGPQGRSYGIPTKDGRDGRSLRPAYQILPLDYIALHVRAFIDHAISRPDLTFNVVAIGCSNSGYRPDQIGPMFRGAPSNVRLPPEFLPYV